MLNPEYKREINQNYLILPIDSEVDPESYQVRMLLTGKVPGLLKCSLQNLNGSTRAYYDITSRQTLRLVHEGRQLKKEDLLLVFEGVIKVIESISEYLLHLDMLVIDPGFIYTDPRQNELFFCYLPGYNTPIRTQFQRLTENLLPIMDHEDADAVMLGYSVYRHALEDTFHLEQVKSDLYKSRNSGRKDQDLYQASSAQAPSFQEALPPFSPAENFPSESLLPSSDKRRSEKVSGRMPLEIFDQSIPASPAEEKKAVEEERKEKDELLQDIRQWKRTPEDEKKKEQSPWLSRCIFLAAGTLLLLILCVLKMLGYLPDIPLETILGGGIVFLATGLLLGTILHRKRRGKIPDGKPKENSPLSKALSQPSAEPVLRTDWSRESLSAIEPDTSVISPVPAKKYAAGPGQEKSDKEEEGYSQTVLLSAGSHAGPASLVSREPGELPTIYLTEELTIIGKMKNAADAVIELPTVSRIHARIRKRDEGYYLTDLNSRNGTTVNGHILKSDEEWLLNDQDEVDFAQARYLFFQ